VVNIVIGIGPWRETKKWGVRGSLVPIREDGRKPSVNNVSPAGAETFHERKGENPFLS